MQTSDTCECTHTRVLHRHWDLTDPYTPLIFPAKIVQQTHIEISGSIRKHGSMGNKLINSYDQMSCKGNLRWKKPAGFDDSLQYVLFLITIGQLRIPILLLLMSSMCHSQILPFSH